MITLCLLTNDAGESCVSSWIKLIGNRTCPDALMLLRHHRRSSSIPRFHLAGDELWGDGGGKRCRHHNLALLSDANVCSLDNGGGAGGLGGLNVVTTE